MPDFVDLARTLVDDRSAAGIHYTTTYTSPLRTVTPPAGTLRDSRGDVEGEFELPDGRFAVTIDSWGSQASRMEAVLDDIADTIGYPLVRFADPDGRILTTTARLSHRHADATWRAAQHELKTAGIPYEDIMGATHANADALLRWYPIALLFGWWHSHIARPDPKDAASRRTATAKALRLDDADAAVFDGYARMGSDSRSARLVTSEILALGAHRRLRMAARQDPLFGPLAGGEKAASGKSTGPSAVGLGSLPPVRATQAPVDVTYDTIEGTWFLSLAGLRQIGFTSVDPTDARSLLLALGMLLRHEANQQTRLRAGTELIAGIDSTHGRVLRHAADPDALDTVTPAELAALVKELGTRVGWDGPKTVTIPTGSILDRLLHSAEPGDADE